MEYKKKTRVPWVYTHTLLSRYLPQFSNSRTAAQGAFAEICVYAFANFLTPPVAERLFFEL